MLRLQRAQLVNNGQTNTKDRQTHMCIDTNIQSIDRLTDNKVDKKIDRHVHRHPGRHGQT